MQNLQMIGALTVAFPFLSVNIPRQLRKVTAGSSLQASGISRTASTSRVLAKI